VFVVRKLGLPGHPELAMGAIASGGVRVFNGEVVKALRISDEVIDAVSGEELIELQRREKAYREGRPPLEVEGKTVIVVDDGVATGSTMLAAVSALRQLNAARIIIAAPVIAASTCREMQRVADEVTAVIIPERFYAVGQWYEDFSQTTDHEVRDLLAQAVRRQPVQV
jgi:predicted phosphoribosyltransferase